MSERYTFLSEQRDDVQAMPAFPAQDCCQMIDGTLVVKLSAI